MINLSREIRFALTEPQGSERNSWAGWPGSSRLVPRLALRMVIRGNPDPETGFLCNVQVADQLVRQIVCDKLIPAFQWTDPAEKLLRTVATEVQNRWSETASQVVAMELDLSPYLRFKVEMDNIDMVSLTEQFEFSAAHRLHSDSFSDEQNWETFGKCNNPAGHGHNYVVDVTVARSVTPQDPVGQVISLQELERIVNREVIDRLDHKHLNRDVEYFADVNPSVENIAIAIWTWLDGRFDAAQLTSVRVYETPKTWAEYCGH